MFSLFFQLRRVRSKYKTQKLRLWFWVADSVNTTVMSRGRASTLSSQNVNLDFWKSKSVISELESIIDLYFQIRMDAILANRLSKFTATLTKTWQESRQLPEDQKRPDWHWNMMINYRHWLKLRECVISTFHLLRTSAWTCFGGKTIEEWWIGFVTMMS